MLQNLRLAMRRQIRRHSARRGAPLSSHRRLGHLWTRVFHGGPRTRGHDLLLDPPGAAQVTLGLQSYRTVEAEGHGSSPGGGAGEDGEDGAPPRCFAVTDPQPRSPDGSASPPSSPSEAELSPVSGVSGGASLSDPPTPLQSDSPTPPTPQEARLPACRTRMSRRLVLELAVNLKGVSLKRYSSLGGLSPLSPQPHSSTGGCQEGTSSPEPSASVKEEDGSQHLDGEGGRRRKGKSRGRLYGFNRTVNEEGGGSGREATPC